jgi:putative DNA methylase
MREVVRKKKLIEVALPLDAINIASAREKSIRHGHPSTLHLWWARRPLASARAVIFAQMVDDPSSHAELFPTEEAQEDERQRLFGLIEQLVMWENTNNERVLHEAREEIWKSWRATCAENRDHSRSKELFDPEKLPAFHDPFAGGGALPLEAQRLGLESHASDLSPVAVLINKALIEIPPKFAGRPTVNPASRKDKSLFEREWLGAQGLADDVRYYGRWMRDEAEKRIGHLYPKVEITTEMGLERPDLRPYLGKKLTVVAWLWARTVKSPNPAFGNVDVPLVSSFILCPMSGKETYIEPIIEGDSYRFTVKLGKPQDVESKNGTKLSRGANFKCLMSGSPIAGDYIKAEGMAGRMSARLMAIVAEGQQGRVYLAPTQEMEEIARAARPKWTPETVLPDDPRNFWTLNYGLSRFADLFTPRQLVALTTLSELVQEAREQAKCDAIAAGLPEEDGSLDVGDASADAYADAVATYLSFLVSKLADKGSSICTWDTGPTSSRTASGRSARVATVRVTFGRQSLPMTWDFAEVNFFSESVGSLETVLRTLTAPLEYLPWRGRPGTSEQMDAGDPEGGYPGAVVSTDPPYYDNISYADLSDFFYVWLRRSLKAIFPALFATMAVPKVEELVASPYRHGSKEKAEVFFLEGMTRAMHKLAEQAHPAFPITIYYAFKQSETENEVGTSSTGWETFLDAVIRAGLALTGTWPIRTELSTRMIGAGTNALASSIILVCRPRATDAPAASRHEFITALKAELPEALAHLQRGNIAPVDLAQAAIGPGMAVYTRYAKVVDAEGKPLPVRDALALINQTLDEALAEQEGDFDADSRWALAWFEQSGFEEGDYGIAETLSKAKNTSVSGMVSAHILASKAGKVRLLRPNELPTDWDPETDTRLTAWESVHHLVHTLEEGGESAAAKLVLKLGGKAGIARELAYRLYTVCERKKRAPEALSYNALVQSWPEITRLARSGAQASQPELFSQE